MLEPSSNHGQSSGKALFVLDVCPISRMASVDAAWHIYSAFFVQLEAGHRPIVARRLRRIRDVDPCRRCYWRTALYRRTSLCEQPTVRKRTTLRRRASLIDLTPIVLDGIAGFGAIFCHEFRVLGGLRLRFTVASIKPQVSIAPKCTLTCKTAQKILLGM